MPNNKFRLSSGAYIVFHELEGLTLENGNVFPGCEVILTSKDGENVLFESDILKQYTNGIPPESATKLFAGASLNNPVKAGTYLLKVRVYDKKNPDKEIQAEANIEVFQ